jgi:hypothetical protein
MSIYWNGKEVSKICKGENTLEIRGEGKSDGFGMTIADVKLVVDNLIINGDF